MWTIQSINLSKTATKYNEKVEKIVMFPQTGEVEVTLYREYVNDLNQVTKVEAGVETVKGKTDLSGFETKAIQFVKSKKGIQ